MMRIVVDSDTYLLAHHTAWPVLAATLFAFGFSGCAMADSPNLKNDAARFPAELITNSQAESFSEGSHSPIAFEAMPISAEAARQALTGRFSGGTQCVKRIAVDLELKTGGQTNNVVTLSGELKTSRVPGTTEAPSFSTKVAGQVDLATGLIQLHNIVDPVDPSCITRMAGMCVRDDNGLIANRLKAHIAEQRAAALRISTFQMEAAKNDAGDGLRGTVRGVSFDCPELSVLKKAGSSPTTLPAISSELVSGASAAIESSQSLTNSGLSRIYWLSLAAKGGDEIIVAMLGAIYESGDGVPKDIPRAIQYFTEAAEHGNALAQSRLAAIYANGEDDIAKDLALSQHWSALAETTNHKAGDLCVAPQMLAAYYRLLAALSSDPEINLVSWGIGAMMGVSIKEGTLSINRVGIGNVSFLNRPFACVAVGQRVGFRVDSTVQDFDLYKDNDGRIYRVDKQGEAAASRFAAGAATTLGNLVPVTQSFDVKFVKEGRYRVSLRVPTVFTSGRSYSEEVDLSAPIVQRQGNAPQVKSENPTTKSNSDRFDKRLADAALDSAFRAWSADWRVDRYEPGSAHAFKYDEQGATYAANGTFSFYRAGSRLTIPFDTKIVINDQNYAVAALCYTDTSMGGTRDCY